MTQMKLHQPCNDCPWRRKSMPGWLGDSDPVLFVASQEEMDMPCHKTVDYYDPEWEDKLSEASACLGGLQFLKNSLKLPRDPELAERVRSVETNPAVFQWSREFLEHHDGGEFKSWKVEL